jgi:hypothetical protein
MLMQQDGRREQQVAKKHRHPHLQAEGPIIMTKVIQAGSLIHYYRPRCPSGYLVKRGKTFHAVCANRQILSTVEIRPKGCNCWQCRLADSAPSTSATVRNPFDPPRHDPHPEPLQKWKCR